MGNESIAVNGLLALYCSWNNVKGVRELLKSRADDMYLIDDNNGGVFTLLISRNYTDILGILIKFYEEQKLQGDPKSNEYRIAYKNLQDTIAAALEQASEPSEEVNEIIAKYLPTEAVYSESIEQNDSDSINTENDFASSNSVDVFNAKDNVESNFLDDKEDDNVTKFLSLTGFNLRALGYDPIIAQTNWLEEENNLQKKVLDDYEDLPHKYWRLNILSEKALHDGNLSLCRDSINEAMRLVSQNPSEANPEYKARVLYNYMKLTHNPVDSIVKTMKNKEFLYHKVIPLIEEISVNEGDSDLLHQLSQLTISKTKPLTGDEIGYEGKSDIEHKLIEEYNDSSNHAYLGSNINLFEDNGL